MQNPLKGVSQEWCSVARDHSQFIHQQGLIRKLKLEKLLQHLDNELARVDALIDENGEQ